MVVGVLAGPQVHELAGPSTSKIFDFLSSPSARLQFSWCSGGVLGGPWLPPRSPISPFGGSISSVVLEGSCILPIEVLLGCHLPCLLLPFSPGLWAVRGCHRGRHFLRCVGAQQNIHHEAGRHLLPPSLIFFVQIDSRSIGGG